MSDGDDDDGPDLSYLAGLSTEDINRTILSSSPHSHENDENTNIFEVMMTETSTNNISLRNNKRRVDEESGASQDPDNEGFTVVKKKAKPKKNIHFASPNTAEEMDISNESLQFYEVSVTSKEPLPKQLGMAKLLKDENVQEILKVTYKSPHKGLIRFKTKETATAFMRSDLITKRQWVCQSTSEVSYTYGVIRDIDMNMEEEEMLNILESDIEIHSVKRLNKRNDEGNWVKSESIRICFMGPVLPQFVVAYGYRMKIESFIFPVTQCGKCWKYGHIKRFCPSNTIICPKCGKKHENCDTNKYKCVNCKGDHMSFVKSMCPAFHKEKTIRQYMSEHNCTYKVAVGGLNEKEKQQQEIQNLKTTGNTLQQESGIPLSTNSEPTRTPYTDTLKKTTGTQSQGRNINNSNSGHPLPSLPTNIKSWSIPKRKPRKNKGVRTNLITNNNNNGNESISFSSSDADDSHMGRHNTPMRKSLLKRLWDKIIDIIFSSRNFSSKCILVCKVIWEEVKKFIQKHTIGQTLLKIFESIHG